MPNQVLIATNSANATENAKFRLEYQVVGGARGNLDWQPTFGDNTSTLATDLYTTIKNTLSDRHGLTVLDDEIIVLGMPSSTHA